jgi:medium-chain acyl-[acyl-carrier-protein] hydrolase
MKSETIHENSFRVRYAETGVNGRIKPVTLFNYFQDAASDHTALLGVSAMDLLPMDLAWVVFRYRLAIHVYPRWHEHISIRTWRCPQQKLYELRRYEIMDADGNLMVEGISMWVLTSLASKKPMRLDRNLPNLLAPDYIKEITYDFIPVLPAVRDGFHRSHVVRLHDLDFNKHVNNSVYAVWAVESVPSEIISACLPTEINIDYIDESLYGDQVTTYTQRVDGAPENTFLHAQVSRATGKEVSRVRTVWKQFD